MTLDDAKYLSLFVGCRRGLDQSCQLDPLQLLLRSPFVTELLELLHLDHVGQSNFLEAEGLALVVSIRLHEELCLDLVVEVDVRVGFRLE